MRATHKLTTPVLTCISTHSFFSRVNACLILTRGPASVILVPFSSISALTPSSSSVTCASSLASSVTLDPAPLFLSLTSANLSCDVRKSCMRCSSCVTENTSVILLEDNGGVPGCLCTSRVKRSSPVSLQSPDAIHPGRLWFRRVMTQCLHDIATSLHNVPSSPM